MPATTKVIKIDPADFQPAELEEPARAVARGGLVVFPTETVYGIAVNLDDADAVARLLALRESPEDKPISVHIGDREDVRGLGVDLPLVARRLIGRFWPGPLTLVLPKQGGGTVGVRFPSDPVAREFLRRCGCRVGAPSANRSGRKPAVDGETAIAQFEGEVDFVIDAGPCRHKAASTVVRASKGRAEVMRVGAIPRSVIEEFNYVGVLVVCAGNTCRSPMAEGILRRKLAERLGIDEASLAERGIQVGSAGTAAGGGNRASTEACAAMKRRSASIDGHRTRPITGTMIEDSNLVFTTTAGQLDTLREWAPEAADRIHLLDPDGEDVPDPVGGDEKTYEECAETLEKLIERRMPFILEALS